MILSLNADEVFVIRNINEHFVRLINQNTILKKQWLEQRNSQGKEFGDRLNWIEEFPLDDNQNIPHQNIEIVAQLVGSFGEKGCNLDVLNTRL